MDTEDEYEKLLCPVVTLEHYLARVLTFRANTQRKLFVSYRRSAVKDITQQTVSVYMKEASLSAYSGPGIVLPEGGISAKPHSIRHVATSLSALRSFSLDDVLKAGAWVNPSTFLKFYVQNFTTDKLTKLSRLGGFVAAGTVV